MFKSFVFCLLLIVLNLDLSSQDGFMFHDSKLIDSLDIEIDRSSRSNDVEKMTGTMFYKGKMLFESGMYANAISVLNNAIRILEKNDLFKTTKDLNDTYIDCINYKGGSYCYMSEYNDALDCFIKIDKINNNVDTLYSIKAYTGMGMSFAMSGNNKFAEEYYRKTLLLAKNYKAYIPFPIYSNMGYLFLRNKEYDSALNYFLEAQKLAMRLKDKDKEMSNLQALGTINSDMGNYALAIEYYKSAEAIAIERKKYSELSFIKLNMIVPYIGLKNMNMAIKVANEALELAISTKSRGLQVGALRQLSWLYKERKEFQKALEYIEESILIEDSIFNSENEERLLKQKNDFEMYRIQSEKEMAEKSYELEEANRKINNIIIIIIIVLLSMITVILTRVLIKQYKINSQLNNRLEDDENQRTQLEDEIARKSRELTSNSLLLVKISEQSSLLSSKLKILKNGISVKSKEYDMVSDIEQIVNQFTPDKSWDEFKQYFDQMSPEFYERLDTKYPNLTIGEKRICAFISLGLTTKEISSLTGKSSGAIDSIKFRIRKKIDVEADVNLYDIFLHLK